MLLPFRRIRGILPPWSLAETLLTSLQIELHIHVVNDIYISKICFVFQCDPNLEVFGVWINTLDPTLPRIALFSRRDIQKGEELTFDYMMTGIVFSPLYIYTYCRCYYFCGDGINNCLVFCDYSCSSVS